MKSPQDHNIIQIDLTNACPHACSNCTRFCGHHTKTFMMEPAFFQRAVDSLQGFPGMIGIMGGEPTIHPQFDSCARYLAEHFGSPDRHSHGRLPITDFAEYRMDHYADMTGKRGLWTSLGPGYYRHFELIQELFDYQCINDHTNPGLHQALLVSRRELGIPDEEWIPLRDACWIQNLWSSCITPKGAFFCEVAGALDMLFNGPGGWPVEPGWWKRTPADFADQLHWCELCGAALQTPRRPAHEEIDDLSPGLYKKLEALDSPKIRRGQCRPIDLSTYSAEACRCEPNREWYLPNADQHKRIAGTNDSLRPKTIDAVVWLNEPLPDQMNLLKAIEQQTDRLLVAAAPSAAEILQAECSAHNLPVLTVNPTQSNEAITRVLQEFAPSDWVLFLDADVQLSELFGSLIRNRILNPGCLYEFSGTETALPAAPIRPYRPFFSSAPWFSLFNMRANALQQPSDAPFFKRWPEEKRIDLTRYFLMPDEHVQRQLTARLLTDHAAACWKLLTATGHRPALYGAGWHTRHLLACFRERALPMPVLILDDAPAATELDGIPLTTPEHADTTLFDILVASTIFPRAAGKMTARAAALAGGTISTIWFYEGFPPEMLHVIRPAP